MLNYIDTFSNAIKSFYNNYFNFRGTANRSEFWFAFFYNVIIWGLVISLPEDSESFILSWLQFFVAILYFVNIIPFIAVSVRRLHDTNRSGWNLLWSLPLIGLIVVLIWMAGESKPNHWKKISHFEVSDDPQFCSSCGDEIFKNFQFCSSCGIKIDESELGDEPTKPSFWRWLWFLVPWLIIIIVSVLFDPITFSPTLIIFAAIITVPRIISTYKSSYFIRRNHIQIIKGSIFGNNELIIPFESIISIKIKKSLFGYEIVFLRYSDLNRNRDEKISYLALHSIF